MAVFPIKHRKSWSPPWNACVLTKNCAVRWENKDLRGIWSAGVKMRTCKLIFNSWKERRSRNSATFHGSGQMAPRWGLPRWAGAVPSRWLCREIWMENRHQGVENRETLEGIGRPQRHIGWKRLSEGEYNCTNAP